MREVKGRPAVRAAGGALQGRRQAKKKKGSIIMAWERAEGGRWQRLCASTPRSRRSTFGTMNDLGEGGGRALAEALRLNTTLRSPDLGWNDLGEGGGRALAETLRLNSTLTSLYLAANQPGEGGGRALTEALRLNSTLTSLDLFGNVLGEGRGRTLAETRAGAGRGTAPQQHAHVAVERREPGRGSTVSTWSGLGG
jgi:hypothetical protein